MDLDHEDYDDHDNNGDNSDDDDDDDEGDLSSMGLHVSTLSTGIGGIEVHVAHHL